MYVFIKELLSVLCVSAVKMVFIMPLKHRDSRFIIPQHAPAHAEASRAKCMEFHAIPQGI
jgi:hypothetical protein